MEGNAAMSTRKRKVIGRVETVVHGNVMQSSPIFADSDRRETEQYAKEFRAIYRAIPGNRSHVRTAWCLYTKDALVEVTGPADVFDTRK